MFCAGLIDGGATAFLPASSSETSADSGFFYEYLPFHKTLLVQHGYSLLSFSAGGHFHEGKSPRLAGLVVLKNLNGNHVASLGEMGLEIAFGYLEGKVSHVDFRVHSFSFSPWIEITRQGKSLAGGDPGGLSSPGVSCCAF